MNFRTCKYFLTTCEMGTINAAARSLFISQQSLSQHIKKLEEELGVPLFYRSNPLILTEAGKRVEQSCRRILEELDSMEHDLGIYRGTQTPELTIGMLDYGIPDFVPPLIDQFLKKEPNVLLRTRCIPAGDRIPTDIPLFFSARELGSGYKSEVLFYDRMVVCVRDSLLKQVYGDTWRLHRARLREGDLSALEGCPFVEHRNTPLEKLSEMAFAQNHFTPKYLPIIGATEALTQLCVNGQAACITFAGQAASHSDFPPSYSISGVPPLATGYICFRSDVILAHPAQQFLDITRRYFSRRQK